MPKTQNHNILDFPERLQVDLRPLGITGLYSLGRSDYSHAQWELPKHTHPGLMEICFLARGKQVFNINNTNFEMLGGDILVSQPDETHSSAGKPMERSLLYWLQLDMTTTENFLDMPTDEAKQLQNTLLAMGDCIIPNSSIAHQLLDEILKQCYAPSAFAKSIIRTKTIDLLLKIIDLQQNNSIRELTGPIMLAIAYISDHLTEDITLEKLAKIANLSLSRFKQRFHDETGLPPREYILRRKLEKAAEMLLQNNPITDIAYKLGFSSSQYFATVFRRYYNQSPRQFQKQQMLKP